MYGCLYGSNRRGVSSCVCSRVRRKFGGPYPMKKRHPFESIGEYAIVKELIRKPLYRDPYSPYALKGLDRAYLKKVRLSLRKWRLERESV